MKPRNRPATHKIRHCDPVCVECGGMGRLVSGAVAHPDKPERRNLAYYRCDCGALVGCHPGTAVAAGRPASAPTRALRRKAHHALDAIWGIRTRTPLAAGHARARAYKWLARQLGLRPDDCHLGWMNGDQLRQVLEILHRRKEAA